MARLQTFKRLNKADFPAESQQLVDQLAVSLNIGVETLYDALNNKLTLTDNIQATVKTFTVSLNALGTPKGTTAFTVSSPGAILGITVLKAQNLTSGTTYPTGAPFISYTQNASTITVNNITGLAANDKWQISVVAWGG